jgi:hypothetical protein
MTTDPFPIDPTITEVTDLMSASGVDTIWLDLDGDLVPETMIQTDAGPFSFDETDSGVPVDTYEADTDGSYDSSSGYSDGGLVGEPMATLTPCRLTEPTGPPSTPTTPWR